MQKTWNCNFYHRGYMHQENLCHGSKLEYISTRGKNKEFLSANWLMDYHETLCRPATFFDEQRYLQN